MRDFEPRTAAQQAELSAAGTKGGFDALSLPRVSVDPSARISGTSRPALSRVAGSAPLAASSVRGRAGSGDRSIVQTPVTSTARVQVAGVAKLATVRAVRGFESWLART